MNNSVIVLAQKAIKKYLYQRQQLSLSPNQVTSRLKVPGACFVTLYLNKQLRGCIGNLTFDKPLYQAIITNALAAATQDWRFPPLTPREFENPKFQIEISLLSPLKLYQPVSISALLTYLGTHKPGLVIEKQSHRAVFLPQVWEEVPQPELFLQHLCAKAGLPPNSWQSQTTFHTFSVSSVTS